MAMRMLIHIQIIVALSVILLRWLVKVMDNLSLDLENRYPYWESLLRKYGFQIQDAKTQYAPKRRTKKFVNKALKSDEIWTRKLSIKHYKFDIREAKGCDPIKKLHVLEGISSIFTLRRTKSMNLVQTTRWVIASQNRIS